MAVPDPADDLIRQLSIEEPLYVNLEWVDADSEWLLVSNAPDQQAIAAALSHALYQLAAGEITFRQDDGEEGPE